MAEELPKGARLIGDTTFHPAEANHCKTIRINPCACIEKIMQADVQQNSELNHNYEWDSNMRSSSILESPTQKAARAKREEQRKARQKQVKTNKTAGFFKQNVKAYDIAFPTKAVYTPGESPDKWRIAKPSELGEYGLKQRDLQLVNDDGTISDFRSQVYIPDECRFCYPMPALFVFKGTNPKQDQAILEDHPNNLKQGVGLHSDYYKKAVDIGKLLRTAKKPIEIAGHSLGGGMASACSKTSGKTAWIYNAAGLKSNTVEKYSNQKPASSKIYAYRHEGEILTSLQQDYWVINRLMPDAAAWSSTLIPCTQPSLSALDRHGMEPTINSFNRMMVEDENNIRKDLGVECKSRVIIPFE